MGGTEILKPLLEIYKQDVDLYLPRHIYLLTDGAVSNTEMVVSLIRNYRDISTVHTFGIGSGVSTELVKNCALAGKGHYTFIDNLEEIETKVMQSI